MRPAPSHLRAASLVLVLSAAGNALRADSTINPADSFAYAANAGWINFRPSAPDGVVVGQRFLSGHAYAANFGWIDLGDGAPANGHTYANTAATDFGVNHDGAGNLSGYAYAANIGWINFSWAGATDPNRPRFDLFTGLFQGYAYSANAGWILLGTARLVTDTLARPDTDDDGIADDWEWRHFRGLKAAGPGTDADGDGQSDAAEAIADTDPNAADAYLRIVDQSHDAAFTEVKLTFATTTPARLYRLEYTTDLAGPWTDSGLGAFAPDAGETTTRTFTHAAGPRHFYRAVAVEPLAP